MLIVASDIHRDHHCAELDGGTIIPSWESPSRADIVRTALLGPQGSMTHTLHEPASFDRDLVEQIHDPGYVAFLESAWDRWHAEHPDVAAAMSFTWPHDRTRQRCPDNIEGQLGWYSFAADCSIVEGTWRAITASAAIATTAADLVSAGQSSAFGLCRPPGHHASRDQFGGYCWLNNAALAAQRLRNDGADRVAIVDIDYHHGNGTQAIFEDRSDVVFASIHADPVVEFPWFCGYADETGRGDGTGLTRNVPLPFGTSIERWGAELDSVLTWILELGCDAMVVSVGVDTHVDDPISQFRLTTSDFRAVGARLATTGLPTVLLLEGGYATEVLGDNVATLVDGFEGN